MSKKIYITASIVTLCIFLFVLTNFAVADVDLFYILPTGKYIINNGIPKTNVFSVLGGNIVIQNWLYCILLSAIYSNFGKFGLLVLLFVFYILFFITAAIFFESKRIEILPFIFIAFFAFTVTNLRPQLLTHLLLMLEIFGLEKYIKTSNKNWLYLLPLSTLLEINFHASYWIFHFIILLPYIVRLPKTVVSENITVKFKDIFLPIVVSIATLFVNPYGIKNITYMFDSLHVFDNVKVAEQMPTTTSDLKILFFLFFGIVFIILVIKKKLTNVEILMYVGFSILLINRVKFMPLYALGVLFISRKIFYILNLDFSYSKLYILCCTICSVILIYMFVFTYNTKLINDVDLDNLIQYMNTTIENRENTTVYTLFQINDYLEFNDYKIVIDARPELYTERISGEDNTHLYYEPYKMTYADNELAVISNEEHDKLIKEMSQYVDYWIVNRDDYKEHMLYMYLQNSDNHEFVTNCNDYYLFKTKENLL